MGLSSQVKGPPVPPKDEMRKYNDLMQTEEAILAPPSTPSLGRDDGDSMSSRSLRTEESTCVPLPTMIQNKATDEVVNNDEKHNGAQQQPPHQLGRRRSVAEGLKKMFKRRRWENWWTNSSRVINEKRGFGLGQGWGFAMLCCFRNWVGLAAMQQDITGLNVLSDS